MNPATILTAALVLNLVGFANYAAVLPAIIKDTGISESDAGIAGGVFFLSYALASPLFSLLTDIRPAKQIYFIGCFCGIAGGLIFPLLSQSYEALIISRFLTGLGTAGIYMPGLRLLLETVEESKQVKSSGVYVSSLTLGLSISFAISGFLEWQFHWSGAFLAAVGGSLAALLLVLVYIPLPPIKASSQNLFSKLWSVLSGKRNGLVLMAISGNSWEGMAFRTWWIAFLTFSLSLPKNQGFPDVNLAMATAFVGLLAMPISSYVAQIAERKSRHLVIAIAASSSVLISFLLVFTLEGPFLYILVGTIIYICAVFSDTGSLPAVLLNRVTPDERGAALALFALGANGAACISIMISGFVLDFSGGRSSAFAWQMTLLTITAGSAVTALIMFTLNKLERQ